MVAAREGVGAIASDQSFFFIFFISLSIKITNLFKASDIFTIVAYEYNLAMMKI